MAQREKKNPHAHKMYYQHPNKLLRPATAEEKFRKWKREQDAKKPKKLSPKSSKKSKQAAYQEKLQLENFIKMRYHTYLSERYLYLEAEEEAKRAQTAPSPSPRKIYLKKLNKKVKGSPSKFKSRTLSVLPKLANVARNCNDGDAPRDIRATEACLQALEMLILGEDAVLRAPLIQGYLVDIMREIRRSIYSSRVGVPVAAEPKGQNDKVSSIGCAPFFEVVDSLQKDHDDHNITAAKLRADVKRLSKELEAEREAVAKLTKDNVQLKYRVMHFEKDNKRLTKDFKFVQTSYIRTSEEFRDIQAKAMDLEAQLEISQIKLENTKTKVNTLEYSQVQSEETIGKLKLKMKRLKDLINEIYNLDPSTYRNEVGEDNIIKATVDAFYA